MSLSSAGRVSANCGASAKSVRLQQILLLQHGPGVGAVVKLTRIAKAYRSAILMALRDASEDLVFRVPGGLVVEVVGRLDVQVPS